MAPSRRKPSNKSRSKLRYIKKETKDSSHEISPELLSLCRPCCVLLDSSEIIRYFQSQVKKEELPKVKQEDPSTRVFLGPSITCSEPVICRASRNGKSGNTQSDNVSSTQEINFQNPRISAVENTPSNSENVKIVSQNSSNKNVKIYPGQPILKRSFQIDPLKCSEVLNKKCSSLAANCTDLTSENSKLSHFFQEPPKDSNNQCVNTNSSTAEKTNLYCPLCKIANNGSENCKHIMKKYCKFCKKIIPTLNGSLKSHQNNCRGIISNKLNSEYECSECLNKFNNFDILLQHSCFDKDNVSGIGFQIGSKKFHFRKLKSKSTNVPSTEKYNYEIIKIDGSSSSNVENDSMDQGTEDECLQVDIESDNALTMPINKTKNDVTIISNSIKPDKPNAVTIVSNSTESEGLNVPTMTSNLTEYGRLNVIPISLNSMEVDNVATMMPSNLIQANMITVPLVPEIQNLHQSPEGNKFLESIKNSKIVSMYPINKIQVVNKPKINDTVASQNDSVSRTNGLEHRYISTISKIERSICKYCGKRYTKKGMNQHIKYHFKINNMCKMCKVKFLPTSSYKLLVAHQASCKIIADGIPQYTCKNCSKNFVTIQIFYAHACFVQPLKNSECKRNNGNSSNTVNVPSRVVNNDQLVEKILPQKTSPNIVTSNNLASSKFFPKIKVVQSDFLFDSKNKNSVQETTLKISSISKSANQQNEVDISEEIRNRKKCVELIDVVDDESQEIDSNDDELSETKSEVLMDILEIHTSNFEERTNEIEDPLNTEPFRIESEELVIKDEPMEIDSEIIENNDDKILKETQCTEVSDDTNSNNKFQFNCSHCNIKFNTFRNLHSHLTESKYCNVCKISFVSSAEFEIHSKVVHRFIGTSEISMDTVVKNIEEKLTEEIPEKNSEGSATDLSNESKSDNLNTSETVMNLEDTEGSYITEIIHKIPDRNVTKNVCPSEVISKTVGKSNRYCNECKITFSTIEDAKIHLRRVHEIIDISDDSSESDSETKSSNVLTIDLGDESETDEIPVDNNDWHLEKKEFNCSHCNVNFENLSNLRGHLYYVKYCMICKKYFSCQDETKSHLKTVHKMRLYSCSYCKLEFQHFKKMQKHLNCNLCIVGENCCKFCKLQLNSSKEFEKHIVTYHASKTKCSFCNQKIGRRVYRHYHKHTLFKPCFVECQECDLKFTSIKALLSHENDSGHYTARKN